jgi:hypothetical protein
MKEAFVTGLQAKPQGVLRAVEPAVLDEAPIPVALNRLEIEITSLNETVYALHDRLTPAVCTEAHEASAEAKMHSDPYPGTMIGNRVEEAARRVRNLREAVQGMIDRLQV